MMQKVWFVEFSDGSEEIYETKSGAYEAMVEYITDSPWSNVAEGERLKAETLADLEDEFNSNSDVMISDPFARAEQFDVLP